MNAVIYARYSSENQREESIEGQIRECTEYADRQGINIVSHYIDRAFSARTADRPEFQRMIRDSEKGLFDTVLVWKLDRFSRDRYDSAHYKHILKKNGVNILGTSPEVIDLAEDRDQFRAMMDKLGISVTTFYAWLEAAADILVYHATKRKLL